MQDWFHDAKLGLFIHYGIYAVNGITESWSFYNGRISYDDYMKQLDGFTASKLDMDYWAQLAADMGAQYAVLTTKHHDGVALFDTAYSDLNTVKRTPAARDIIKEYTDAFRKKGIRIGLYYSLLDWSHPDYASVYQDGVIPEHPEKSNPFCSPLDGREDPERWQRFVQFNRNQLAELLQNYGAIDLLWFDGDWERSAAQWGLPEFKNYLLSFQNDMIINSRLRGYGDYETPEQGLPVIPPRGPWECCMTINDSWGYQGSDTHYKSLSQIFRIFTDCIAMGGNLLLDIGPREDGTIDERQVALLNGLGKFVKRNAEAIYGTEAGLPPEHFAGASTLSKDKKTLYLFVAGVPSGGVCIKGLCSDIKSVTCLHNGKALRWDRYGGAPWFDIPGLAWIFLPEEDCASDMTVVKIELDDTVRLYRPDGK